MGSGHSHPGEKIHVIPTQTTATIHPDTQTKKPASPKKRKNGKHDVTPPDVTSHSSPRAHPHPRRNDVTPSSNGVTSPGRHVTQSSDKRTSGVHALSTAPSAPAAQNDARGGVTLLKSTSRPQEGGAGGGKEAILQYVANGLVGKDIVLDGPFGKRQVLYLDYIASGRPLTFIEEYINKEVLPRYANTHTTTSTLARQTTAFRNDARNIIRRTTNATEDDVVIFTGSGVTGAIHKLIHALNFTEPPVVFIGPYEHHSNILPWREMGAEVIRIRQTTEGLLDMSHLEEELKNWAGTDRRLVGSFSAASNVTGILCDVDAVSVMLHRHGALAMWDYATAAPYVTLDMNPALPGADRKLAYKDAMFISPHKFVGGVSTPGLLIAKKNLFMNEVPHGCGGGTVLVVRQTGHRYLQDVEEREEGGTPAIVGAIRTGLVFQLKAALTPELVMERERELFRRAKEAWEPVHNLIILGNLDVERLPVFSLLVHHPQTGFYLHQNFLACLLNDLFGIQARGGCACAGPYAMDLLDISEEQAEEIEEILTAEPKVRKRSTSSDLGDAKREIFKPGFTRLNLPYFISEEQLQFVLQAVAMVAIHGWKLLPQYKFNPRTGEWKHQNSQEAKVMRRLDQLSYTHGYLECRQPPAVNEGQSEPGSWQQCLDEAMRIFNEADKHIVTMADQSQLFEDFARDSRWFLLPSEANELLRVLSSISCLRPAGKEFFSPRKAITPDHSRSSATGAAAVAATPAAGSPRAAGPNRGSGPSRSTTTTFTTLGASGQGKGDLFWRGDSGARGLRGGRGGGGFSRDTANGFVAKGNSNHNISSSRTAPVPRPQKVIKVQGYHNREHEPRWTL